MLRNVLAYINRRWARIRVDFPNRWKNYLYQSFLAMAVVFIVLWLLTLQNAVVIASIGATAFIVFTMPKNITAQPRRVIGGHILGLVSGSLCSLIPHTSTLATILVLSLAVGISICLMVAIDVEHPPASGTALGIAILTSSLILSLAHYCSKRFLKDLI